MGCDELIYISNEATTVWLCPYNAGRFGTTPLLMRSFYNAAAQRDWRTLQGAAPIRILVYRYLGSLIEEGGVSAVPENRGHL